MKLFSVLTAALIIFFCCGISAHALPQLVVDDPTFNFGTIPQGKKVSHIFAIKNSGDAPLTIQKVRPSCGCTAANASTPVLQPGKTGEIKITFNSANFSGKVSKTVFLDTNDPKSPAYTLTLTGTITEEIQIAPRQLNLGKIKVGTPKGMTITVTNRGDRPLKLISVKAQIPQLAATIRKNQLKAGESGTIDVTVTPRAEDDMLSGYLSIATDNPQKSEILIPVYASPIK
jgi:copper(I)-binding protein